ncbi:MAG: LysE family translocator [Pseudomonadota bacterium]
MIGSIAAVLFAAAITPGPNNLVVMSAAARGGLRGAVAPIVGIVTGTLVLVLAVQLGLNVVLVQWPEAVHVFRVLAVGLLFYIGVRIVLSGWADKRTSLQDEGRGLPLESLKLLLAMLALQIVNPKTWVLAATVGTTYAAQESGSIVMLAALTIAIPSLCLAVWAAGGLVLAPLMERTIPRRVFAVCAGGALIGFAGLLFLSGP